jgi:hypothetical protein
MKISKIVIFVSALALLLMALAACSGGSANTTEFPTGKFVSTSNLNQVYRFNQDNSWEYYLGGLMSAKGTYRVDGNLWIEEGTDECPSEGTYEWTFDGQNLTFKLNGLDICQPRKAATDGLTFQFSK